ncbi:MAG TPA: glycosyltransferase family 4 protein [Vicinamibacterales bacterium]|nr:glycosyltransferase family 4 protein [Vicinamibacterales bacterium]
MSAGRPTRILYCETNVDGTVGGSYYSLLYLLKGLDRKRYHPIALFSSDHTLMPAYHAAGIETIIWPGPRPYRFAARVQAPVLHFPLMAVQKAVNVARGYLISSVVRAAFLRKHRIDVVHLNNSILYNHDWMLAAKLAGAKGVCHERGINDQYPATAKYFGKRLDAIVCISDAVRTNMQEHGAGFPNIVTIPNGLDPDAMRVERTPEVLRATLGLDASTPVVGMVGNIKAWKGQHTVVHAMDRIRRECPDVRCVFVGDTAPADQPYDREVRALVAALELEEHIIFAGFQRNVTDFLNMFDVVIHASVAPEPFGRVILEAMACRKAVVGARAGAIPEIVDEGKTGLTFPPADADCLADAVIALMRDRRRAEAMGQEGYCRLVRHFHIARNVESTERLYESLLGAH